MLKILLITAILFRDASGFAINNICNQYVDDISLKVISSVDRNSKLIQARGSEVSSLIGRLIENATAIRKDIVDTFSCEGRVYGYYADQDNDCQIFHVCLPMQQLFPEMYCEEDIFHFSFICPLFTIFNQEAMVCDWTNNAFPCSEADQLYARNNLFFVVPEEDVQRESSPTSSTSPAPKRPSLCCSNRKTTTVSQRLRLDPEAIATTQSPPSIILDEDDENQQDALDGSSTEFYVEREDTIRSTTTVSLDNDSKARFDASELFERDPSVLDTLPLRQLSTTSAFEEPHAAFSGVSNIFTPLPDIVKVLDVEEKPQTLFPIDMKDAELSQTTFPSAVKVFEESHTTFSSAILDAEDSQKNFSGDLKTVEELQTTSASDLKAVEESLTEVKNSPKLLLGPFDPLVYEDEVSTDAYQPIFTTHEESSSIYPISERTSVMNEVISEANIVTERFWNVVPTSKDPPPSQSLTVSFEAQKHDALPEATSSGSHKDPQNFGLQSEHRPTKQEPSARRAHKRDGGNSYGYNGWLIKHAEGTKNSRLWNVGSY